MFERRNLSAVSEVTYRNCPLFTAPSIRGLRLKVRIVTTRHACDSERSVMRDAYHQERHRPKRDRKLGIEVCVDERSAMVRWRERAE